MTSEQKDQLHRALIKDCTVHSCLNCELFDAKIERCSLAPSHALPATVVVFGCKSWTQYIPF